MDKLLNINDVIFEKNNIYNILLIGKQGVGKTTISKLLTFDNDNLSNKICTSLNVGTNDFGFSKI